jgi:hypothetical protein
VQGESSANAETVETTTAKGLQFLNGLKTAKDKKYVPGLAPLVLSRHQY